MIKRQTWNLELKTFLSLVLSFKFLVTPVYAANPCPAPGSGVQIKDCFGFGGITSLGEGFSKLLPIIFSAATFLVIFYFLLGALQYLRAGGNKEEVGKGRQMITHAVVGFVLLILSFLVIQFLLSGLFGEQTAGLVNIFKK